MYSQEICTVCTMGLLSFDVVVYCHNSAKYSFKTVSKVAEMFSLWFPKQVCTATQ